eukprot:m.70667 g.70667  ORF g.70667 m.70667 type:complete len:452 (-) comp11674_c1_seq1:1838-3193(-)
MPLESTVVCLDSSEFMRNGDFLPNRLQAERDAANLVVNTKLRDNPESTVAILTMGNKIDVRSTLTADKSKLNHCLHGVEPAGEPNFLSGIMVAQLILRHRQTKNHRQRIVTFIGSPIKSTEKELVQLGKKLKKSNVNVDVISFGEEDTNQAKLEAFINAVNKEDESHLVVVPSGSGSLSNSILSSPMLGTDGQTTTSQGNDFGAFGGLDMESDPELAMALRLSLEEERQRQQRADGDGNDNEDQQADDNNQMDAEEDDELAAALLASQRGLEDDEGDDGEEAEEGEDDGEAEDGNEGEGEEVQSSSQQATNEPNFAAMTEEEMLQYALQLSVQETGTPQQQTTMDTGEDGNTADDQKEKKEEEVKDSSSSSKKEEVVEEQVVEDEVGESAEDVFDDPDFLASVLGELPGVNKEDADDILASFHAGDDSDAKKKEEKKVHEPEEDEIDDVDD